MHLEQLDCKLGWISERHMLEKGHETHVAQDVIPFVVLDLNGNQSIWICSESLMTVVSMCNKQNIRKPIWAINIVAGWLDVVVFTAIVEDRLTYNAKFRKQANYWLPKKHAHGLQRPPRTQGDLNRSPRHHQSLNGQKWALDFMAHACSLAMTPTCNLVQIDIWKNTWGCSWHWGM